MKLILSKEVTDSLNALIAQKNLNRAAADILNDYLENHYDDIDEELLSLSGKKDEGEKSAFRHAFFSLVEEEEEECDDRIKTCHLGDFTLLSEEEYKNDPYYQNVPFRPKRRRDYRLTYNHFSPDEGFVFSERQSSEADNYAEITPVGYFKNEFSYPVLRKKDVIWRSVIPHEINTRKKAISLVKGKVLTFGLGLGYFAYMASRKEEVEEVTVIEKDRNIISLFESEILPYFPNKQKIKIIHRDCFSFLEQRKEDYPFVFIDIYHQAEDALPLYLRRGEKEKHYPKRKFLYWIEGDILILLRRYVLTLLEEASIGYTLKDYENPSSEEEKILLALRKKREAENIATKKDLYSLLSDDGLRELVRK